MSIELFEQKYHLYKNLIFHIAFTYVKNKEDCEDIIQEVFIKYMWNRQEFEDDEHEKRWLIKVTVNQCKNFLKLFWNKNKVIMEDFEKLNLSTENQDILLEVMSLPRKYKIVIYLHYYEGYKCREIGEILDQKESTIKMRLKKGRELLGIQIEKGKEGGDMDEERRIKLCI